MFAWKAVQAGAQSGWWMATGLCTLWLHSESAKTQGAVLNKETHARAETRASTVGAMKRQSAECEVGCCVRGGGSCTIGYGMQCFSRFVRA